MKYLKKFNERLSPEIYKRAGIKLKELGKTTKGSELINYYDNMVSGFYNVVRVNKNNDFKQTLEVTRPSSKFIFGKPHLKYDDAEDLVHNWIIGSGTALGFTIQLDFILKDRPTLLSVDKYLQDPIYFYFELNSWLEGKEEYSSSFNIDIYDFYKDSDDSEFNGFDTGSPISLKRPIYFVPGGTNHDNRPNLNTYTLFDDRKSAFNIKKVLKDLIIGKYINEIMDIFNIIGADSEDIKKIEKSINDIRLNKIYIDSSLLKGDTIKNAVNNIIKHPINN